MKNELLQIDDDVKIAERIHVIRGQQVILDSDVAFLFRTDVKKLNQQMKRNVGRFPIDFCFKLNSIEFNNLRSQNVTIEVGYKNRKYLPYAYTEHGIIALAGVLKSDVAEKMSVEIVRQFIQMKKFITENGDVLLKLAQLQNRQINFEIETNKRFDEILKLINKADLPKQVLFFDGQYYDAYDFISSLIRKADKTICLIDPFCDNRALTFLSNKKPIAEAIICKSNKTKLTNKEIDIFIKQYGNVQIINNNNIHDRFLIIDNIECYSLGTSLNFAGKKTFVITKIEDEIIITSILERIGVKKDDIRKGTF